MRASVIIPTLNAEAYLPELFVQLRNQTKPPHEIVIVDSQSTDMTASLAADCGARVIQIAREQFDHGGTRNLAAKHATGDVLVFMTQDAQPMNDRFVEELLKPLNDSQVAAVYGRQEARTDANALERMTREINYPQQAMFKSMKDLPERGIKLFFFSNVCSAIRSDLFQQVGGFPETTIMNEDMLFAAKCILEGLTIVYNPKAEVLHSHNYTLRKQFQRNFDIGVFLRMNDWILQYATAEKEGIKLIRQQLGMLIHDGYGYLIPRWFAEAGAKYVGYRMGLAYRLIPLWLRKKLSMHSFYWDGKRHQLGAPVLQTNVASDSSNSNVI
ncbi:glycosyltransferase [Cohnella lubricantis]|uniref:Glycosyltransferase family 2 protein n=1 Tax=Cohnella lubricantis TaxID=2163172 RepID=A0A841TFP0_9BACL|nr:glycosyltransferase [Cohnella lubricantis]MBB6678769.1 glycosyltransferase family 2 protein [Cohnella lubricantis]MBP2117853.1 rhamnosyltransferase [Cohnella lubricantis]